MPQSNFSKQQMFHSQVDAQDKFWLKTKILVLELSSLLFQGSKYRHRVSESGVFIFENAPELWAARIFSI